MTVEQNHEILPEFVREIQSSPRCLCRRWVRRHLYPLPLQHAALDNLTVWLYSYSMLFHVNPSSGLPLYVQIESQVKNAIAAGALQPHQALPSVRNLAAGLGINPTTAARAYQNLERDGVITTVPGGGTYVAENVPRFLKPEKLRRLQPYARQIAVEGAQLLLTDEDILKLVQEELDRLGVRK
jgi:GntR family transcriptional regulator